jgi:hypothetical protein
MPEREGRDGDAEEATGQCEGELRDISWDRGHCGCFGTVFGLILYGKTPFSYVFTVSCAGLAFGSLLLPPDGAYPLRH